MNILKNDSIVANDFWKVSGCPRSGPVFEAKKDAYYKYKLYLRDCRKAQNQNRMDALNNNLVDGHQNKFWTSYKHFNYTGSKTGTYIDGLSNDTDIANCFATNFKNVYNDRNVAQSQRLQREFDSLYRDYSDKHSMDSILPYYITWPEMMDAISKLKTGKASATFVKAEHILYGSPKLVAHLHILFNAMLQHSYVPVDFLKGVISPLIKDSEGDHSSPNNYRGLTLGVVFSFIFEHVILLKIYHLLTTDSLQFGYKRRHSISHAVYTLRSCIDYFTSRGSSVLAAFLDCSKGFDKVEHSGLFTKLIQRGVPLCILNTLMYWYSNLSSVVKWNGVFSHSFSVKTGVRQGGVLSPRFFILYLDDLFLILKGLRVGCHIMDTFIAAIIYADDICLLAPNRSALQLLLNACQSYGMNWCLTYNPLKSKVMTFGSVTSIAPLRMYGKNLQLVNEYKYLGINVVSGKCFSTSTSTMLRKFRCSVNTILNVPQRSSEQVLMKLLYAICVPLLTYGCDSVSYSTRQVHEMTVALNDSIRRIFSYQRWESISTLRKSFGYKSITEIFHDRTKNFLGRLSFLRNPTLNKIKEVNDVDIQST